MGANEDILMQGIDGRSINWFAFAVPTDEMTGTDKIRQGSFIRGLIPFSIK